MKTLTLLRLFLIFLSPAHADAGIDAVKFREILEDFSRYAQAFLEAEGAELRLNAVWAQELRPLNEGGAGGASASGGRKSKVAGISVVGGLARHPLITADAFRFALCHELGHYAHGLGNEFGADAFAAQTCLPALLKVREEVPSAEEIFAAVDRRCELAHGHSGAGVMECRRAVRAAWSVAQYSEFLWAQIEPDKERLPLNFDLTIADLAGKRSVPACRLLHITNVALGESPPGGCL